MTEPNESFWDELGVRWCSIDPDVGAITPRLRARLRQQSRWISVGVISSALVGVAGLILGIATIAMGWNSDLWHFVIRGLGITAVSALAMRVGRMLLSVQSAERTASLGQMLELAIQRSMRMVVLMRLGLWACGILAISGLIGTAVRTHFSGPPQMSPILDMMLLGLVAAVLHLYGRLCRESLARYTQLKRSVAGAEGGE